MHSLAKKTHLIKPVLHKKIHQFLENALCFVYGPTGQKGFWFLFPLIAFLNRWHALYFQRISSHAYLLHGRLTTSGEWISVALVGLWDFGIHNNIRFFQHLLFRDEQVKLQDLGEIHPREVKEKAEQVAKEADLVLVQCNDLLVWKPSQGEWLVSPEKVRMVLDFPDGWSWEQVERQIIKRDYLRVVRKSGCMYRISREDEDFHYFYHRLYSPMVRKRFAGYGSLDKEENLYSVFKSGFLILVEDSDHQVVAGGLRIFNQGVCYAVINGVLDGDRQWVKKGALMCSYYYTLRYAFECGFKRVDMGRSAPFENDGVYIHKKDWGFKPLPDYWAPCKLLFWVPNGSEAALEWLQANPVIPEVAREGGKK